MILEFWLRLLKKLKKKKNFKTHSATKVFQALRIFVNKEISELIEGIIKATRFVKEGGKIIFISFHSIEDKIIKFYFSNYSLGKSNPSRYLPNDNDDTTIFFKNKNSFITPSSNEIKINPSSRSAKLRFAIRNEKIFKDPIELRNKFRKYLNLEEIYV